MTLRTCLREVTNREFNTWQEHFQNEWNEPNRTDHYLMQVAQEVRRVLHKTPADVKSEHFKLTFTFSTADVVLDPKEVEEHERLLDELNMRKWFAACGISPPNEDSDDGERG